ncbi:tetratricopeptide repeat protein [Neolewinella antarctica]|uniref:Tetratricopeptide (TPR) repeat protein n=1 Tax=Neolewinella antarctica TaxID=442734 RepID=A0ABX0XF18_9BACT|nr:tetratricopeptide repeat protein [Neolewinella antarctica]NJC27332.1 tetratricopeptide (TPR) repeat protein [Neolewinella antarctica]
MSEYKIIIAGQLEFGNQRVYTQVYEQYLHRMEHYYKDDILLKPEGYFKEEELSLVVPRTVLTGSERHWMNTLNLLQRVVDFSIAGSLNLWRLDAGKMIDHHLLEPKSERTTVQIFNKGRELIEQSDQESKASELMTKVVKRFARHSQAYERRGFINLKLGNIDDALYDYNKSLSINPAMPEAHYGRGIIYSRRESWEEAATDYEAVTKNTIPYQPLYWMAQVALGDAYLELGRPNDALRVYNMFFKRKQRLSTLDRYTRRVNFEYAKLLANAKRFDEAYGGFKQALEAQEDPKAPTTEEIHFHYGKALEEGGKKTEAAKQFKLAGKDFPQAVETTKALELSA